MVGVSMELDSKPPLHLTYPVQCRRCQTQFIWVWDHTLAEAVNWWITSSGCSEDCDEELIKKVHEK